MPAITKSKNSAREGSGQRTKSANRLLTSRQSRKRSWHPKMILRQRVLVARPARFEPPTPRFCSLGESVAMLNFDREPAMHFIT